MVPARPGQSTAARRARRHPPPGSPDSFSSAVLRNIRHSRVVHVQAPGGALPPTHRAPRSVVREASEALHRPETVDCILGRVQCFLRHAHGRLPSGRRCPGPGLHGRPARRYQRHMVEDVQPTNMAAEREE